MHGVNQRFVSSNGVNAKQRMDKMRSMRRALLLICMCSAAAQSGGTMSQQLLPDSIPTALGGRCMDGSMAGYYWREGTNKDLWVINMQGGGACYSKASCTSRASSALGSSTKWGKTANSAGFQVADCATNPDFCEANQA